MDDFYEEELKAESIIASDYTENDEGYKFLWKLINTDKEAMDLFHSAPHEVARATAFFSSKSDLVRLWGGTKNGYWGGTKSGLSIHAKQFIVALNCFTGVTYINEAKPDFGGLA